MKIYLFQTFFVNRKTLSQIKKFMKLFATFIFCTVLTLYAETGYSQKERVHLSVDNTKIADVLKEIEQQTNYLFFYNHAEIGSEKFVSLNADMPINQLLDNIFKDTDVKYTVLDKHIVLTTNPELNKISTVIQGITITGIVTDEYGEPMPGASVLLKGITQGTVTDSNGAYSLQVPDGNATLVFSFIGFTTQEILVGAQRIINVTMSEDARQIGDWLWSAFQKGFDRCSFSNQFR